MTLFDYDYFGLRLIYLRIYLYFTFTLVKVVSPIIYSGILIYFTLRTVVGIAWRDLIYTLISH